MHVAPGQPVYVYSAVFAPVNFSTRIVHSWQRYNGKLRRWMPVMDLSYPIKAGATAAIAATRSRSTRRRRLARRQSLPPTGRLLGRVRFRVDSKTVPANLAPVKLD